MQNAKPANDVSTIRLVMSPPSILIIEDNAAIRRGIVDALRFAGYGTLEAATGQAGLEMALAREYALLLLDLVLPGTGGMEILASVRRDRPTVPVIVLTARGAEADRVAGLRGGADDYVVKPFGVQELLARIEAVLRRSPERPSDVGLVTFAGGVADLARMEVRFGDGRRIELSPREVELLRYLACNVHRAISRAELLTHVWRVNPRGITTRTIDMHVARLREKLGDHPDRPATILTVRGKGYMFAGPPA
jgi:DNA-binding response OmpR family regulator